jgi:hypothetical protein
VLNHARGTDFLNLYTGASFALHWDWQHVYTAAGQLAREQQFMPERREIWPFVRPPVYAMVMEPLALLPFPIAFVAWICAQTALFLGCLAWAWRRFGPEAALWGALFFGGPLGIANGQDCALFLTLLCLSFVLGEKHRMFLCGLVLGLGLMKFHLFLMWPLVLLVQKRWRLLAGFTVSGLTQALLTLAVLGWGGMRSYADFILHLNAYYAPEKNIDINAILLNAGLSSRLLLILLSALIVALILWCARKPSPLWMTFALATAGSLLVAPHAYGYDGTMLLLPVWSVIFLSRFRIAKLAAATICTPITAIAAGIGPPFACFFALTLVVFVVAICVESQRNPGPSDASILDPILEKSHHADG